MAVDPILREVHRMKDQFARKFDYDLQKMFDYLAPELRELGYSRSPYLAPLIQSVYGEIPNITPPFTEADFQLSLYLYKLNNRQDTNLVPDLISLSKQYAMDNTKHPLQGRVNYPPGF